MGFLMARFYLLEFSTPFVKDINTDTHLFLGVWLQTYIPFELLALQAIPAINPVIFSV